MSTAEISALIFALLYAWGMPDVWETWFANWLRAPRVLLNVANLNMLLRPVPPADLLAALTMPGEEEGGVHISSVITALG